MIGRLYICATPIGNLDDVTLRVLQVLSAVDLVAAEDTRRTRKLLARHGVSAKLISYRDSNEREEAGRLAGRMKRGARIALVTDSGMPTISDPGYRLVRACIENGIPVEVVPGPSAALSALAVSGLPTDRFAFEGFLPKKQGDRARRLGDVASDPRTLILFEAPGRVRRTLLELKEAFGDRTVAVARELTKVHEEVLRGSISEIIQTLEGREVLGEVVLVVAGAAPAAGNLKDAVAFARARLEQGATPSRASAEAASRFGLERRRVYDALRNYSAEKGSQD